MTTEEQPSNDVILTEPVKEETVVEPTDKFDGLSNRDALQRAIEIHKEGKEAPVKEEPKVEPVESTPDSTPQELEPPAEFSAAGKAAWKARDIAGIQKEYKRIHDARTSEITRAQQSERRAREEAKTWEKLGETVAPYLKARGEQGVTPQQAMMEAIALVNALKTASPAEIKAELKKLGKDLDQPDSAPSVAKDPHYQALQTELQGVKSELEQQKIHKTALTFDAAFKVLGAQKTRTGEFVFPDLHDFSERGIEFAKRVGSRTADPYFRSRVEERFPGADFTVLVREAYKAEMGRVSGEPVQVSTESKQKQIERSRRASAAAPGRTTSRPADMSLNGKLSTRAALAKAIEIHRGS